MPEEEDPYELERYWVRLQGPRPEPPRELSIPFPFVHLTEDFVWVEPGFVWVDLISTPHVGPRLRVRAGVDLISTPEGQPPVYVGPRSRVKAETSEVTVEVHCQFPVITETTTYYGAAVWQSRTADWPLYVNYTPARLLLPGDHVNIDLHFNVLG
jgi:hypothetical protein